MGNRAGGADSNGSDSGLGVFFLFLALVGRGLPLLSSGERKSHSEEVEADEVLEMIWCPPKLGQVQPLQVPSTGLLY